MEQTERTTKGLTDVLFEELDNLRNGKSTPGVARSKSALVNSIISVKRVEIEISRFAACDEKPRVESIQTPSVKL